MDNAREKLADLRAEIDCADKDLLDAFTRRMDVAARIAECKREGGIAVNDPGRERQKMADITSSADQSMRSYTQVLYSLLFELSRSYQEKLNMDESPLYREIRSAIDASYTAFPASARVACQGVEGAYSQFACDKIFPYPSIMYFSSFEDVFRAVDTLGCEKEEILYVGDSDVDMITAENAGLVSIGVTWGFRDEETLRNAGAVHIVNKPCEILKIL